MEVMVLWTIHIPTTLMTGLSPQHTLILRETSNLELRAATNHKLQEQTNMATPK